MKSREHHNIQHQNIQNYLDRIKPSQTLKDYLELTPDEILKSIDKILDLWEPGQASLLELITLSIDIRSKTKLNPLDDKEIIRLVKNSGFKSLLKQLQRVKNSISNNLGSSVEKEFKTEKELKTDKELEKHKPCSKKEIIRTHFKGSFIKPCPCSPECLGCNYYVIVPGIACPFDCSYCFLKFYAQKQNLKNSLLLYSNTEDLLKEIKELCEQNPDKLIRLGTGEFVDSLAIKELDELNLGLAKTIRNKNNIVIEFKTKSTNIAAFLSIPAQENVILSWSLNPQWIIDKEEAHTASLKERLEAAQKAIAHGYRIALHLDPIFMEPNTLDDYIELVDHTFTYIDPQKVMWLSMGGFRYTSSLKLSILKNNNGEKWYLGEKFEKCKDGKFRYPKATRLKFYNTLGERIKSKGNIKTYLCMELPDIWKEITWGGFAELLNLHPRQGGSSIDPQKRGGPAKPKGSQA
jgi:spore photoproduct lyase